MSFRTKLMVGLADIQHIVVFGYKAGVPAEKKAEIATRFLALKDLAKRNGQTYIVSITGGKATSKEGFDQGLEQAFVVTFKNEADRDYFVGKPYSDTMDPAHEALVQVVVPLVAADSMGSQPVCSSSTSVTTVRRVDNCFFVIIGMDRTKHYAIMQA
jgi:hypothetical protein